MKKLTLKSVVIGTLVWTTMIASTHAYNLSTWSSVQYLNKIILTTDGTNNMSNASIQLDGANGTVKAKTVNASTIKMGDIIMGYTNELDNVHWNLYLQYRGGKNTIINSNGWRVGINTSSPKSTLDVNGIITTEWHRVATEGYAKRVGDRVLEQAHLYTTERTQNALRTAKSYAQSQVNQLNDSIDNLVKTSVNRVDSNARTYAEKLSKQATNTAKIFTKQAITHQPVTATCNKQNVWKFNGKGQICQPRVPHHRTLGYFWVDYLATTWDVRSLRLESKNFANHLTNKFNHLNSDLHRNFAGTCNASNLGKWNVTHTKICQKVYKITFFTKNWILGNMWFVDLELPQKSVKSFNAFGVNNKNNFNSIATVNVSNLDIDDNTHLAIVKYRFFTTIPSPYKNIYKFLENSNYAVNLPECKNITFYGDKHTCFNAYADRTYYDPHHKRARIKEIEVRIPEGQKLNTTNYSASNILEYKFK